MHEVSLPGCTPEPLMGYLKALGVFRLVAEQADPSATLCWKGGIACLTSTLDRDGLVAFFRDEYRPTPIVVPWSGGDFFGINLDGEAGPFKKVPTSTKIINAFLATKSPRLEEYRGTIKYVVDTMKDCGIETKADIEGTAKKVQKARFLSRLRAGISERVVEWMDAAAQPNESATSFNQLLGSGGGSDGNTHFSDNFMQSLWDCLADFDAQRQGPAQPKPCVANALFNELSGKLVERTGALYDSGAVGGPNATQGFIREFLVNPWNFVLGMEGLLAFAGGLAKRNGSHSIEAPSFPFLIRMTAAGSDFGSAVAKEYGQYEVWLPIWAQPISHPEMCSFFREGRAQVGRRPAQSGTDMSRAISTKGVSAGIDEFQRFGLIRGRVGGENYFTATSVGRYRVHFDSSVTLLDQLDPWLTKFAYALRDEDTPARLRSVFNRLDTAITDHCRGQAPGTKGPLLPVIRMLGEIERTLSRSHTFCKAKGIRPIAGLSAQWLEAADDGSAEFHIAAALAGIAGQGVVGPLRMFLEEVEFKGWLSWSQGSTSAVWSNQSVAKNLAAVFRRRQMEAFRSGISGVPLDSKRPAPLAHVLEFLKWEANDPRWEKLGDLFWALIGIDWNALEKLNPEPAMLDNVEIPFEFGLFRLLVNPLSLIPSGSWWKLSPEESDHSTKHAPDVFHAIEAGRLDSVDRATSRLRACGLPAVGNRNRQSRLRTFADVRVKPRDSATLLAAMLIPISNADLITIANTVLYPPEPQGVAHV